MLFFLQISCGERLQQSSFFQIVVDRVGLAISANGSFLPPDTLRRKRCGLQAVMAGGLLGDNVRR